MGRLFSVVVACVLLLTIEPHAQDSRSVRALDREDAGLWFVELSSPPTLEGTATATLEREEAAFHEAAANAGIRYAKGRHFQKLWNGLTVRGSARDMSRLRALPGVQSVFRVATVALQQRDTPPVNEMDLVTALKMTGVDVAQSELGLTGRGVTVAVIDTGIDYDHPDLGGCLGRHCRVVSGYDLVGDAFDSSSADPDHRVPHPDPDPDDCNGHGTHVSGIIGANGGIRGVAPSVRFQAYRVFGCDGTTTADLMLEAMEMALDGKADVVNMSIGSALSWPEYPTAKGADRLVKHGMVVIASIGNEGQLGLYAASAPGIGKDVIGVASFENSHANLVSFTISPDGTRIGYTQAAAAPAAPTTGSFPMARTGTATTTNDGCVALAPGSLTGRVALIRRGTCSFYTKAFNAQTAGAVGLVLYDNVAGFLSPTVAGTPAITIPVVMITAARGVLIDGRLATGGVTITWTSVIGSEPQSTGGLISSTSSYGLPPDLSFKPDIGAPGGVIRSTLPLEQGGYGNISGTSMSAPHVAGAAALLLEARPHDKPKEIERRLQNTARPALWRGNPTLGVLDNVYRQGAGMLEVDDAVLAEATVSPSSLALGEIEAGAVTKKLRISLGTAFARGHGHGHGHGHDDDAVTYTLGHEPGLSTGANTFTPTFSTAVAAVSFSTPSVAIGHHHAPDEASITVTITPPAPAGVRLFGGYITLTPDDGGIVLRVPYAGYHGDYQAIVALTPTPNGFPWLAKLVGSGLVNQPGGASFTLEGDDIPFILLHLDHQTRHLALSVIDVATDTFVGFADSEDFLPRNSVATSFFAFEWDGTIVKRPGGKIRAIPNGTYRMELTVLKALGDPRNPAHTEHWTSPNIVINRPLAVGP